MTPHVAIIVLNWNNAIDTLACLDSLEMIKYPAYSVLVVDNGSTDDSVAQIKAALPRIEILETGENLGYAGGNNVGIRHALAQGADYVCMLNNDVTVAPDFLSELVQVAEADPRAGLLGPKVLQREAPSRLQSAGMVSTGIGRWQLRGLGELDEGQYDHLGRVAVLSGCALLASRRTIESVGLLDERFYLYDEDIDWCLRCQEKGYQNRLVSTSRVYHRSNEERAGSRPLMTYYINRNRHLLCQRHGFATAARLRLYLQQALWITNWTLNPKWRSRRTERDALLLAMRDVILGRYGKGSYRHG